jgi:hypothetical protein
MNRYIDCLCGESEEFPADEQRHHCQFFDFVDDSQTDDNNATYICPNCKSHVVSTVGDEE